MTAEPFMLKLEKLANDLDLLAEDAEFVAEELTRVGTGLTSLHMTARIMRERATNTNLVLRQMYDRGY